MSLTKIARNFFSPRWRELERYQHDGEGLQREVLARLLDRAKDTEYGRNHLLTSGISPRNHFF